MFKRKTKRTFALILVFILTLYMSTIPIFAATQIFSDVPQSAWFYNVVGNLAGKGIINGYPNGTFRPHNNVERQHVAVMVLKGSGIRNSKKKADFSDVSGDNQFTTFIATLAEKGIINGFPDGTFRPKSNVTRAQAAIMISKAFGLKRAMHVENFRDTVDHYASNQILILNSHGIINGYSDGTFRPKAPVTRAELSKMISFAMEAASGSTKYQPDPAVQKAENAVRIAERKKTYTSVFSAQGMIEDLPNDKSKQQLKKRLNKVFEAQILFETEPNNLLYEASFIDRNIALTHLIFGNITNNFLDKDYYRFEMPSNGRINLMASWLDKPSRADVSSLVVDLLDANGNLIQNSSLVTEANYDGYVRFIFNNVSEGVYYLRVNQARVSNYFVGENYFIRLSISTYAQIKD